MSIPLDQQSEVLYSLFLLFVQVEDHQIILKPRCWPLAFTSLKFFFLKKKRSLGLVSLPHFLHYFWIELFLILYYINRPNFFVWLPLFLEILDNMCISIVSRSVKSSILKLTLLSYQGVFLHDQKRQDKNLNILKAERNFKMK